MGKKEKAKEGKGEKENGGAAASCAVPRLFLIFGLSYFRSFAIPSSGRVASNPIASATATTKEGIPTAAVKLW